MAIPVWEGSMPGQPPATMHMHKDESNASERVAAEILSGNNIFKNHQPCCKGCFFRSFKIQGHLHDMVLPVCCLPGTDRPD
jgi:hypothetical protein